MLAFGLTIGLFAFWALLGYATLSTLRVRMHHAIVAVEFDAGQHLLRAHGAELQQHDEEPAEVRKHLAADRAALLIGAQRKRGMQVVDREAAMAAVEEIERAPEERAHGQDGAHRQQPDRANDAGDGRVFDAMPKQDARGRGGGGLERVVVSQQCHERRAESRQARAGIPEAARVPL